MFAAALIVLALLVALAGIALSACQAPRCACGDGAAARRTPIGWRPHGDLGSGS